MKLARNQAFEAVNFRIAAWGSVVVKFKLTVYHPGVFTELSKTVFTSQTHLLLLYSMYYSGNMFRLVIESSSGPYIKIQILNLPYIVFLCKGLMMTQQ